MDTEEQRPSKGAHRSRWVVVGAVALTVGARELAFRRNRRDAPRVPPLGDDGPAR